MSHLKDCPFCGNPVELEQGYADITYFLCGFCGVIVSFRPNLKGAEAIDMFNQRAEEKKTSATP